jgi:gluconolactonase
MPSESPAPIRILPRAILAFMLVGMTLSAADTAPEPRVEQIATGFSFTEGCIWIPQDGGFLLFSDIPKSTLHRWDPAGGAQVFRTPSGKANGNTLDKEGRIVTCEHGNRRVSRTKQDGTTEVLAGSYDNEPLNSPNDVVVKSDGSVWFTDPPYGLEGREKRQKANYVFRLDPATKTLTPVAADFDMPNGLCFSPDEKKLYIADSGKPHHIRVFDVNSDNTLSGGGIFAVITPGVPDGMRCDSKGNLYTTAGDGIHIYSPDGKEIRRIPVPETPANVCIASETPLTLYATAQKSVYKITFP